MWGCSYSLLVQKWPSKQNILDVGKTSHLVREVTTSNDVGFQHLATVECMQDFGFKEV